MQVGFQGGLTWKETAEGESYFHRGNSELTQTSMTLWVDGEDIDLI